MKYEIQPFSLTDAPESCAIIFFHGCNLRCKYCHNPSLVEYDSMLNYDYQEDALLKEIGNLQGINPKGEKFNKVKWLIFSGGEPFLLSEVRGNKGIFKFLNKAKNQGLKVGVYTNGVSQNLCRAISENLIDFVNIDFKHIDISKVSTPIPNYIDRLQRSIEATYKSYVDYKLEYFFVNTVVCKSMHTSEDLKNMRNWLDNIMTNASILYERDYSKFTNGWVLTPFNNDFNKNPTLGNLDYNNEKLSIDEIKQMLI
jgi:pyruvate formate lyase activating enzyme